jgi:hypothetical protein
MVDGRPLQVVVHGTDDVTRTIRIAGTAARATQ